MPRTDKIYLIGFMGAGKSSVGRALAQRLGWKPLDIDEWIEQRERRSIADIFQSSGEAAFRAIEREAVQAALVPRNLVVATGGGTFVDAVNRASMLADGLVIWLDVAFETVVGRVPADGRRPLARDRAQFQVLFAARAATYRLAHLRLEADGASVSEVVERILDQLGW